MRQIIEKQIQLWREQGIVDDALEKTLRDNIAGNAAFAAASTPSNRFSLFQVLSVFAAIAFCAGVLLLVAANWDLIPRLVRVCGIVALIFMGLVGGAVVNRRRQQAPSSFFARRGGVVEEACYSIGGAAYVGGVALVGQMYHLPGRLDEAMFGFGIGLALAACAVRSRVLGLGALVCMVWWYSTTADAANLLTVNFVLFGAAVVAMFGLALLRDDRLLKRAVYVAAIVGLFPFLFEVLEFIGEQYQAVPKSLRVIAWIAVLLGVSAGLWVERYRPAVLRGVIGFGRQRVVPLFLTGTVALLALYGELQTDFYYIVPALLSIGFSIWALMLHGAAHKRMRYLAYIMFLYAIAALFGDNVLTMLGSSGLLFVVSGLLAIIAFALYRLERRFAATKPQAENSDA